MTDVETGLRSLMHEATVRLRSADGDVWGSGFFVAPGWVLTCAHVLSPHLWRDTGVPFQVQGDGLAGGRPCEARLEAWLLEEKPDSHRLIPPEQDLALVRVDDPPSHTAVWLSDRPPTFARPVLVGGYAHRADGRTEHWEGSFQLIGSTGRYGLRGDGALATGVSGGPVFDTATGAVVGVVARARRGDSAALLVSTAALHDLGPLGLRVLADHDRWHARSVPDATDGWATLQRQLVTGLAITGDQWSPDDRRTALALLSALPPPEGARPVADILLATLGDAPAGMTWLPPRTWREGHGMLYGHDPTPAAVFLRYLRLVVLYTRHANPQDADAFRLDSWIRERLTQVAPTLRALVTDASLPSSLAQPRTTPHTATPFPARGDGHPVVTVELEPLHYAMPPRFYWRIAVDQGDGELITLEEECVGGGVREADVVRRLAQPLADAFSRADLPGLPAPLEVALPPDYFDLEVHLWRAHDAVHPARSRPVGEQRSVVLRDLSRRSGRMVRVRERWEALQNAGSLTAVPVEQIGRGPDEWWQRTGPGSVPVFARPAARGPAGAGTRRRELAAVLEAGFPVALWSTRRRAEEQSDDEQVRGAVSLLGEIHTIRELPDSIRRLRYGRAETRPEGGWAQHMALFFDDPHRPLPSEDFELDAP
ncbi:trypsin-like peptidase domain-containing protein [Streptomyces sp. NPDC007905]|uniref:VMAP-C domain-containing protein n=1 Tax=Streptomyces sp. NPDC007905 TaxID=3364788 RepID=UPI0036E56C08